MKFSQKITILAAFLLMPAIACTNESKQESATEKKVEQVSASSQSSAEVDLAANSAANVKVFNINSVAKAEQDKAVDFTWTEDGKTISFKEFTKGKVVFLNFWGTWCPPCRAEIPDIIEISKDLTDKDFVVIGIATERVQGEAAFQKVSDYAKDKGIPYHLFLINSQVHQAYGGISSVPTTFIIDKKGEIAETIIGMRSKADFMTSINRVLK